MFKAKFAPAGGEPPRAAAQQQQQQPQPAVPPVEDDRELPQPVREPGPAKVPERALA